MTAARRYEFETHDPAQLYVELGRGSLHVTAADTAVSGVEITGRDAERVEVRQDGRRISVVAPRQLGGFFGSDSSLVITVTVPHESDLALKTGSADILVDGTVGAVEVKSGSGDVRLADLAGPGLVETGSGDVTVEVANAELRVKSGSGEVVVRHTQGAVAVSTGSGDVQIRTAHGPVAVKTGSGDLRVAEAHADVSLTTGSGDLVVGTAHRGRLTAKGASGGVRFGMPAGVPVWTDISTVSGTIRSGLAGAGEPADGADHIEVRAKTVTGDVALEQV